jgi:nucleoporin SEH1
LANLYQNMTQFSNTRNATIIPSNLDDRMTSTTATTTLPSMMVDDVTTSTGSTLVHDSAPNHTTTTTTQVMDSYHTDYILATAIDIYGRRMATVSGDRTVRIWDLQGDGSWSPTYSWPAHKSAVTAVCWAHAEFGNLLATAGNDQQVNVWEEFSSSNSTNQSGIGNNNNNNNNATRVKWILKASLTDARRGVTCTEFAPRQWGLKLATGSLDGCVRIYEAVDVMNLEQWPIAATLQAFTTDAGCTSISWCTGRFDPPTFVTGGSHVILYRYSETARAWQSVLQIPATTNDVLDVAWAPNVGRRFHYIAVANEDTLRIFKLSRETQVKVQSKEDIVVSAWRCQWNVTGTVLASSGNAGTVTLYKRTPLGAHVMVTKIQGDPSKMM